MFIQEILLAFLLSVISCRRVPTRSIEDARGLVVQYSGLSCTRVKGGPCNYSDPKVIFKETVEKNDMKKNTAADLLNPTSC